MINLILTVLILLIAALIYLVSRVISEGRSIKQQLQNTQTNAQALGLMQQEMSNLRLELRDSLEGTHQRLDTTLGQVHHQLGAISQALPNIFEIGNRISELQNIMQAPKLRGGMGEYFLANLLEQVFGANKKCYTLQYGFKSGEKVDAVIHISDKLVPVDAKFPFENFKKYINTSDENTKKAAHRQFVDDIKKHIISIATKYILPDEGTFDFALMYIPAENVYYEIIIKDSEAENKSLQEFAMSKKIIPVSPNSFYPYLQVIIMGLKGLSIEKNAQEVIQNLYRLHGDLGKFTVDFKKLGTHLKNSTTCFDEANKRLDKFQDKLKEIENLSPAKPSTPALPDLARP